MPETTTGSTEQTYLKLLAGSGPGRFIVGVLILLILGLGEVTAASAQSQIIWALHISLVPAWFDPADVAPPATALVVMSALHDALVKPMPGQPLAPSLAESWQARLLVIRYGYEQWGEARIHAEILQIAAWAQKRNVRVMCNEFGVYRRVAPAPDRVRWIADVRTALEIHGIGWTMWDYAGDFGLVTKQAGQIIVDEPLVSALGLPSRGN